VRRLALQAQHQQEHDSLGRRAHALVLEVHRRRELIARAALGDARRKKAAAEAALESLRAEEAAPAARPSPAPRRAIGQPRRQHASPPNSERQPARR
jgi:hypothetical protein